MAGALRSLASLPVTPVIAGGSGMFTVHESDLMAAIAALAEADRLPGDPVSVAHPEPVSIREILQSFAAEQNRRCRFVPVPWQLVYATLRSAEAARLKLPFRADSLLGLVHRAPSIVNDEAIADLGVTIHGFSERPAGPLPAARRAG
jgi:hypothetical protein